jgi:hypothetical protein
MADVAYLIDFAKRIIERSGDEGVTLRLLGGVAVYLNCPNGRTIDSLRRDYKDLDFVIDPKSLKNFFRIAPSLGLREDKTFNALHGATRLLFFTDDFQIDFFVGVFEQCQKIDLARRLTKQPYTISIADLFLTKIQIIKMNEKDIKDLLMLLVDHDFGYKDKKEKEEMEYILSITSSDWGWFTTAVDNLKLLDEFSEEYLDQPILDEVRGEIAYVLDEMNKSPKTLKWKIRKAIGKRVPWYEEPEEVRI